MIRYKDTREVVKNSACVMKIDTVEERKKYVIEQSDHVPAWVSSPEKPAIQNSAITQGSTICIISKAPLNRETTYLVTVRADVAGTPWTHSWSFTTTK